MSDEYATPGQLIKALLDGRGWSQRVLAVVLGVEETIVNKMTSDTRPVDASMAVKLGDVFALPAEKFHELQQSFDLAKARIATRPDPARNLRAQLFHELPIPDMIKRGWLNAGDVRNVPAVEKALAKFFGVNTVSEIEILSHAAKKTSVFSPVSSAQLAWIYRAKKIAQEMLVAKYSPQSARAAVARLAPLRATAGEARRVPRILLECGIRFVIVETLPSAKIDGVCFWLNDFAPVIGMSMRHDRIDNFWFVLRHELEHVIRRHGRHTIMLDSDLDNEAGHAEVAEEERAANLAAADFCVPTDQLQKFLARKAPVFAERDIVGFARTLKVHPGLVAGQLRQATGRFDRFHNHLVKIRSIVAPNAMVDGWGDVAPVD